MAFFKQLVSLGFDVLISDLDVVWLSSHWQRWMSWDDPRPPLAEAAPLKMSYLWNGWEPPPTHRPLALMIVSVLTSFFSQKETTTALRVPLVHSLINLTGLFPTTSGSAIAIVHFGSVERL